MRKSAVMIATLILLTFLAGLALSDEGHKGSEHPEKFLKGASWKNGRQIYFEGVNLEGQRIPFEGGPRWLYMHGGGCLACHGQNGKGGIFPHMCDVKSSAITYKSLTSEEHGHEAVPSHGHEEEHAPYTIDGIRQAVINGINPAGKPLNLCMPRWKLNDKDFKDLMAYLVKLDEQ